MDIVEAHLGNADVRAAYALLKQQAELAGLRFRYKNSAAVAVEFVDLDGEKPYSVIANQAHLLFYLRQPILSRIRTLFDAASREFGEVRPNRLGEYRTRIHDRAEMARLLSWLHSKGAWPSVTGSGTGGDEASSRDVEVLEPSAVEEPLAAITPRQGLVIDEPWMSYILSGRKLWEMRSRPTSKRGPIALIRKGSGQVVGTASIVDCLPPVALGEMPRHSDKHWIPRAIFEAAGYKWFTPWLLANVRVLEPPVPYQHPSGAVTWVDLSAEVQSALQDVDRPVAASPSTATAAHVERTAEARIQLTGGNIRNGHFYLRTVRHLLPPDAIGGSNSASAGMPVTVNFVPGETMRTDVDGEKMIFRERGPVRRFFERAGAHEGDELIIARTGARAFSVSLAPTTR